MVFESVLIQVLNRVLGDYVENLDRNQLNVGIWGGDVELKNLLLKQSALSELDLPIQTVYGCIGKLVLKIPWKNLYGSPFIINVEDIYLLAEPNLQVSYDAAKEEKKAFESKQKEIKKVEDAKKIEQEKNKAKADYTFVEKLITQIIKNVQLNIKNIHIRYEDKVTRPGHPFALGITLSELNVLSTNEEWLPAITQEDISKIFKIVSLEGAAIYWNSDTAFYANLPQVDMVYKLRSEIGSKNNTYILGPISSSARLKMNQKPENDVVPFSEPKIQLNLNMEKLYVGICKSQYKDIISLADSMDRMRRGVQYRKFRPNVDSYKGHYKEWWHFAYQSILEIEVKRQRDNWDWAHMLTHRQNCKQYGILYKKKLLKSAQDAELKDLESIERKLDLTNIVIIRQRIELETERLQQNMETAEKKSWFGWMWGQNSKTELQDMKESTDILKEFATAMTPEEKSRLFKAIDYQENAAPAIYPEAYVDNTCVFILQSLEVTLCDDEDQQKILCTELKGVKCKLQTRPAGSALRVHLKIDDFNTNGLKQDDFHPNIIKSMTEGSEGLLEVTFETKPLNSKYDQLLHLKANPLRVIYDAQTINKIVSIFKVTDSSALDQLSEVAGNKLSDMKERTTTGIQYAVDKHFLLDVDIDLRAPLIIMPYNGKYKECENVLVANLGNVKITSIERKNEIDLVKMNKIGLSQEQILETLLAQSYDQFKINLTDMQVIMAQGDEDWEKCILNSKETSMHLLSPVSLNIVFANCFLTDDPRLPLHKLSGELPSINFNISDFRLMLAISLITSIPFPETDVPSVPLAKIGSFTSSAMLNKYYEDTVSRQKALIPKPEKNEEVIQFTTLDVNFIMNELIVNLSHQENSTSPEIDIAAFKLTSLQFGIIQKTFHNVINVTLGGIYLHQNRTGEIIDIIYTPAVSDSLFKVTFTQVDRTSPDLHSLHKSCEQRLDLDFNSLELTLHLEGLLSLISFGQDLQNHITEAMPKRDRVAYTQPSPTARRLESISETLVAKKSSLMARQKRRGKKVVETIKFKVTAQLQELTVKFASDKSKISSCSIKGINTDIIIKDSYTQIDAILEELAVIDLNPESVHSLIIKSVEKQTIKAQVVINNLEDDDKSDTPNMLINVSMQKLKIVFMNWFIQNMLNFLNNFQTAQAKVIEASQEAVQTAKENMKEAYEKATKIKLNISLKAPVIIIPVNSKSYEAVLVDLGYISLSNSFLTIKDVGKSDQPVVIDDLRATLTDFKIGTVLLNTSDDVIKEHLIVEPINFMVVIKRNLSSWYKKVADIDVSAKIKLIKLRLSQTEYKTILSILSGNLAEGQQSLPEPQQASSVEFVSKSDVVVKKEFLEVNRDEPSEIVHETFKFTFNMDELILELYNVGSEESIKHGLGTVSLPGFSIKGRILSDQSIVASIILVDCLLIDTREGREGKLNRLVERSHNDGEGVSTSNDSISAPSSRSMVDITFQKKNEDTFVDLRIFSFTLILSIDYLLKLAEFFKVPEDAKSQTNVKAIEPAKKAASASTAAAVAATESPELRLTLNLKLEKPDIILVESMDDINTNAIILNNEFLLKFRQHGDHQVLNGTIKDLSLYTCVYNPEKRLATKKYMLDPVTISLAGSTPEGKGLHLELLVTNIHISVSPVSIELLTQVINTSTAADVKEGDTIKEQANFSDLWKDRKFEESEFWFLKPEAATEVVEGGLDLKPKKAADEMCFVTMPSISVTVETGVGNKTLSMLMLETNFKGKIRNWSSQIHIEASMGLEMGYYNSSLALWEPLIEPISTGSADISYIPWDIKFLLHMSEADEIASLTSPSSETEISDSETTNIMYIDIKSENNLELTVTKNFLEVVDTLQKAFASAISSDISELSCAEMYASNDSPYKIVNETGVSITLMLDEGPFKMFGQGLASTVLLNNFAEVPLQLKNVDASNASVLHLRRELAQTAIAKDDYYLNVHINDKHCDLTLPVLRADTRFFIVHQTGDKDSWGIISDVKIVEGVTIVTLRSILQVYNNFKIPIDVYYMTNKGNSLELVSTIEPDGCLSVPLHAVYSPTNELFFSVSDYSVSTVPFIWKDLMSNVTKSKLLQCQPRNQQEGAEPFFIKAIGEMQQVYYENTRRHTMSSTCYNIHLRPAVCFRNSLPIDIEFCVEERLESCITVTPGDSVQIPNLDPGKSVVVLRLPDYLEKEWSCRYEIAEDPEQFAVWTFNSYDSSVKMALDLGMHTLNSNGSILMILYSPFWMLNKTGLNIGYRNIDDNLNVLRHPSTFKGPILFSFNAKNFFGKKKASICVEQGDWSDKFSLDVAGSSGVVSCKYDGKTYQIGVQNQLTYNGLTKQITFTPFYVIMNTASFTIECQENNRPADPWLPVLPNTCAALWPVCEAEDKMIRIRAEDSKEASVPFLYSESHTTLLKLNNKYGGINVDIQITEGATYINFAEYDEGLAPGLIINYTKEELVYWEKDSIQKRTLPPKTCIFYTWENPSGHRTLMFQYLSRELQTNLLKDEIGEYTVKDTNKSVYYSSFLDGMQRTLLVTEEEPIAKRVGSYNLLEKVDKDITLSIHGVGISFVNNTNRQEVMYIGMASTGIIWEQCKLCSKRFKKFSRRENIELESAYQDYINKSEMSDVDYGFIQIDSKTEVNFGTMEMYKPHKRRMRRVFETGLWFNLKSSPNQMQMHARINRLQIDNQMYDCIFPVVLAPVPPPKSVAADTDIKPFVELSIVQLLMNNSQIKQYKYFKVLVQEFHVKVDMGFINAIIDLFQSKDYTEEEEKNLFSQDLQLVNEALYSHVSIKSQAEQKSYFDLLHFSPLKIHVSFSLASGASAGQSTTTPNFINVLLQGLGVTLTDMQDVVFKLAFFERNYHFLTSKQLMSEVQSHYVGQSIKQLYVLVLGLDVIGNPYGLVLGITKGVEDLFYEPFQGAIQGPGEFAEGLALGVRSLFGHTVGGAAGAVSKITGAMGKGLAALTFDDEFQRKRRDQLNKKPTTAHEGFARSGKGLVMGVVDGVTGVFTKPVSGAKEEGFEGFFKGLGKGAIGLVARPTAGLVDFASGSFDVVKRAADSTEDTMRLRAPRFIPSDGLIRPYNFTEAEGYKMLMDLEKGKYSTTDVFICYFDIIKTEEVLLLTDKRLAYIKHSDIFGGWQLLWSYTWKEINNPVKVVPKGVLIPTADGKKKLFKSSDGGKTILVSDPAMKEEICGKIESLRETSNA